jgi:hypothetical protein
VKHSEIPVNSRQHSVVRDAAKRNPGGGLMSKWINRVKRFLVSEDGPMAVEYAILLWQVVLVNT